MNTTVIDAGPQPALLVAGIIPGPVVLALQVTFTPNGRYGNASSGTLYFASAWGSNICGEKAAMLADAEAIRQSHQYLYGLFVSNSNTLISTLLAVTGTCLSGPPDSPGWGGSLFSIPPGSSLIPVGPGF